MCYLTGSTFPTIGTLRFRAGRFVPTVPALEADSEGLDAGCVRGDDLGMDRFNIEALEPAVKALNDCDVEPFVGLMAKDMVWRGHQSRWLWWREAPS